MWEGLSRPGRVVGLVALRPPPAAAAPAAAAPAAAAATAAVAFLILALLAVDFDALLLGEGRVEVIPGFAFDVVVAATGGGDRDWCFSS